MVIKDFVIPFDKDELLQFHTEKYFVRKEDILSINAIPKALDRARTAWQSDGPAFILENFGTFFSIMIHFNKIEISIVFRAFDRIHRAIEQLLVEIRTKCESSDAMDPTERKKILTVNKMLVYLYSSFAIYINKTVHKDFGAFDIMAEKKKKKKKAVKSDEEEEWDEKRLNCLELIHKWFELPLIKLWQPQVIEDAFINILTQVCYEILEKSKDAKEKQLRQTIFQILGLVSKKYNQGMSCVIRIIQLVKLYDYLAAHLASGVVHMVSECGCNGLIRELLREINVSDSEEAYASNISTFLETIVSSKPELILPVLDSFIDFLSVDSYTLRNCALGVFGAVIQANLTEENLDAEMKQQRDECLDYLEEHILDCSAYVRSKALQIWQKLSSEGAIPLIRQGKLLRAAMLRLEDKNAIVRKQALVLLRTLLESNPFAATLDRTLIAKQLEDEKVEIEKLKKYLESNEASADSDLDKTKNDLQGRKLLVEYYEACKEFSLALEEAMPLAETLLFSKTTGDAVESCTFLGTAFQFNVQGSIPAFHKALYQLFKSDESVRDNTAAIYKKVYFTQDDKESEQQKAVALVARLMLLLKTLEPGLSLAVEKLIVMWYKKQDINNKILQVIWQKFTRKIPNTTHEESRLALNLLTMVAEADNSVVTANLDILIQTGFGPEGQEDLLFARDTCRALLKLKQDTADVNKAPLRYKNSHPMFEKIMDLLKENFGVKRENGYASFATDAINVIYHLANQPDDLMTDLIRFAKQQTYGNGSEMTQVTVSHVNLTRLLYMIGHIAIRHMVHLESVIAKELKRRNVLREMKTGKKAKKGRNKSIRKSVAASRASRSSMDTSAMEDNGEEALQGPSADDADIEAITASLENEILSEKGLLGNFKPLVLTVCKYPDKYPHEDLQSSATIALCKMMCVSSSFCEENLQLLFTILERSASPNIRVNILIQLKDLTIRFPNAIEPWTRHIYDRLRDDNKDVRMSCVHTLSNLIMREMIRIKGQVSELALCIVDDDKDIRESAKQFFLALSQKGNSLYNIIPDILSRLSDPKLQLEEDKFQEIFKNILGLIQKEKQVEPIIEKLCTRLKLASDEQQWRNISFCLSLLQFSSKSIRRLTESLPLLKEQLQNKQVYKTFCGIIENTKKKADAKAACVELSEKIDKLLQAKDSEEDDKELMPPPASPKTKVTMRKGKARGKAAKKLVASSSESSSSSSSDSDSDTAPTRKHKTATASRGRKTKTGNSSNQSSDEESHSEEGSNSNKNSVKRMRMIRTSRRR